MTRKIIFIIIGALLFLALLWILWFWLLHRAPVADNGTPGGFATSSDRTTSGGLGVGESSNTGTPLPGTGTPTDTGIDTQAGSIDTNSSGGSSAGGGGINTTGTNSGGSSGNGISNGAWIGSSISTREFTPAQINDINNTFGINGAPLISATPQAAGLGTSGLIIGIAAAGCLAQYLAYEISGALQTNTTDRGTALLGGPYVVVFDFNASAKLNNPKFKSIEQCLVKTIAQAAIDQITRSGWGAGGWGSFLQFTTVPTNNPYGAYAYAQMGLNNSIGAAQANARSNVSAGGFISLQKCDQVAQGPNQNGAAPGGLANCKVTTPGAVIEESLKKSLVDTPIEGLNLAQNINEIITALTNQVMIKD